MKIGKPLLLITTPIGVAGGIYEAYRLAGGLVFLMLAMLLVVGTGIGTVVMTVRREKAQARALSPESRAQPAAPDASMIPASRDSRTPPE